MAIIWLSKINSKMHDFVRMYSCSSCLLNNAKTEIFRKQRHGVNRWINRHFSYTPYYGEKTSTQTHNRADVLTSRLHQAAYQRMLCGYTRFSTLAGRRLQQADVKSFPDTNPFSLVQEDLSTVCDEIHHELISKHEELGSMARYHFDGKGKAFRPMLAILVARACNVHRKGKSMLTHDQKRVALIAEMIHTASLVHDDVIDASTTRRGKPSAQSHWGQRKAIMTGDFILSVSSQMLARIRNEEVVIVLSKVLEDLVRGEFMQLGSKEDENERFHHYLRKTYKKTASLIANSCKAVAILGDCSDSVSEIAFQYGKNIGIAFQLVDDLLDFTSCDQVMGKPTAADLKLGLATAPVLFAAQQHPELHALIMRRFAQPGDVENTRDLVAKSRGVEQTRHLVDAHSQEAIRLINELKPSQERQALMKLTDIIRNRDK